MTKLAVGAPKLVDMHYRIVRALGTGAGSTILLVADSKSNDRYALKVVKRQDATDDVYIAQAVHEFEVARRLNHASLLKIYDCRIKRSWFRTTGVELLMEYVDGRTLDELEAPERGQLVLIFIHVASALGHMHRRGVYHGDLKPGNIMLSREGQVKVIDFGTAWIKGEAKDRIQGTPQYMAPEQASEKVVDSRTDLYNFGATMYRMFTGHHANLGMPAASSNGGLGPRTRPKPPISLVPNIPGTLNEAIMVCLEANPERRPAGMFEVKHQLIAVARHMGLRAEDLRGVEEESE
jgi:serine/threonine-protein kinase